MVNYGVRIHVRWFLVSFFESKKESTYLPPREFIWGEKILEKAFLYFRHLESVGHPYDNPRGHARFFICI